MAQRSGGFIALTTLTAVLAGFATGSAAHAQVVNGGFESGDFTGWTTAAFVGQTPDQFATHNYSNYISAQNFGIPSINSNGVVTAQFGKFDSITPLLGSPVTPTEGSFLAFLSNETNVIADPKAPEIAGNGTLAGTSITQKFLVPVGATNLTFNVQYLSNELMPTNDPQSIQDFAGWDFGGIALLKGDTVLQEFNLDHDSIVNLGADVHATATPSGGFSDSTGWVDQSFNLSGLDGQTLSLVAYVTNTGDQQVESRLLLDNIQANAGPAAVPEPGSMALLAGMGVTGSVFAVSRFRRRK